MAEIRIISEGTTSDHDRLMEVVEKSAAVIKQKEPGVTSWEFFSDQAGGRVMWLESYEDVDAFVAHVEIHQGEGILDELLEVYDLERLILLTPVDDPRLKTLVEQFGIIEAPCRKAVVR